MSSLQRNIRPLSGRTTINGKLLDTLLFPKKKVSSPFNLSSGDIVVVRSPINPNSFICKRIVGLSGDSIRVFPLIFPKTVPRGHVWLQGDNINNSTDSREFGALPMGLIIGRVVLRIWPLDRIFKFTRDEQKPNR